MYALEKLSGNKSSEVNNENTDESMGKMPVEPLLLSFVEQVPGKAEISAMSDDSTYIGQTQGNGGDYRSD